MSENYYYTDADRKPAGPVSLDTLQQMQNAGNILPDTLVWKEGMPDWRPLSDVLPGVPKPPVPAVPPTPGPAPAPYGKKPSTYLVHSILVTLFCCLPFGIVAIVMSSRVDSLYYAGRYQEAEAASKSALLWGQLSFFLPVVIYAILLAFAAAA